MINLTMESKENRIEKEKTDKDKKTAMFESLIDEYRYKAPKKGQILEGQIVSIDEDTIILDVGLKRDAIITNKEIRNLDEEIIDDLSVGDMMPVSVNRTPIGDQNLLVSIDAALEYKSWENVKNLLEDDLSVELKITGSNKGGLLVQFDQLDGFVPNSQNPSIRGVRNRLKQIEKKEEMIGSTLLVKPIEVNSQSRRLVFSAIASQKERRRRRLQELEEGSVIEGKIVNLVDFGVFVDLNGVDGLIHISELDWHRLEHPSEIVDVGDKIEVKIVDVDVERERVKLSRRELLPGPWEKIEDNYQPGDLSEVKITNVVEFGAFAELPEGVQGLIHNSEIGYTAPINAQNVVAEGQIVLVKIINVDAERERISLSMRRVPREKQLDWMSDTEKKLSNS